VIYRFGNCELDTARFALRRDGTVQAIEPQVLRLLLYLIENRHRVITRTELFDNIWRGRVVADAALYSRIKSARAAIGDGGPTQAFIRTVSRTGYQFVAAVEERTAESEAARASPNSTDAVPTVGTEATTPSLPVSELTTARVAPRLWVAAAVVGVALVIGFALWSRTLVSASTARAQSLPTIAVLPFLDLSSSGEQDRFADGLTEEITDQLTQIPGVRVAGRTSAYTYKDRNEDLRVIAKNLGVENVLEGSVRREGERLRITTQLIDSSGKHIWSRTYDRDRGDLLAIQNDVARTVAITFNVAVNAASTATGKGGTTNREAYDAYLSARAAMIDPGRASARDVRFAISQLERTVALDPEFAMGWTWLSLAYVKSDALPEKGTKEWKDRARQAAARANELAPDLPWVLAAEALVAMQDLNWSDAEKLLARARASAGGAENPWSCSGCLDVLVGRPHDALKEFQRAAVAEPARSMDALPFSLGHFLAGELDDAERVLKENGQFDSAEPAIIRHSLTQGLARRDRERIVAAISRMPENNLHHRMLTLIDDREAALAELQRLAPTGPVSSGFAGYIPLGLWSAYFGDQELALRYFGAATQDSCNTLILWNPMLKDMRQLPGFKTLMNDLKLVDYWRETGQWNEFCHAAKDGDFECS
jgi:TolB-like protein/DNA-binding winged helix-turn-helix (wHTH) protein